MTAVLTTCPDIPGTRAGTGFALARAGRVSLGAVLRKALWRSAFWLTGGLRVTGTLPYGPLVVVANHGSHADTAALLAALPARRRPVVAAAMDYWYIIWWRRILVSSLVAALPVRRGSRGAYTALRAAAEPVLAGGDIVIVFPEGTRSADGSVAAFRAGAVRLARAARVPVVPVTLVGTRKLLPKHGRLSRGAIEVRIGTAMSYAELDGASDDGACETLRTEVVANTAPDHVDPVTSPVWRFAAGRADARSLLAVSFAWGFAEAIAWPVLAEMYLILWLAGSPNRITRAAIGLWLGSVAGVVVHAVLSSHGIDVPLPWTTPRMQAAAAHDLGGGAVGMLHQALAGIPVRVYAAEAGHAHLGLGGLAFWTAFERGARILGVACALTVVAARLQPLLRRYYGGYVVLVTFSFAVLMHLIIAGWR